MSWGTLHEADSFVRGTGDKGTHWCGERPTLHHQVKKAALEMCLYRIFLNKKNNIDMHGCRQKVLKAEQRSSLGREMELGKLSLVGVSIFVLYCFINIYYVYSLIKCNKYSFGIAKHPCKSQESMSFSSDPRGINRPQPRARPERQVTKTLHMDSRHQDPSVINHGNRGHLG